MLGVGYLDGGLLSQHAIQLLENALTSDPEEVEGPVRAGQRREVDPHQQYASDTFTENSAPVHLAGGRMRPEQVAWCKLPTHSITIMIPATTTKYPGA